MARKEKNKSGRREVAVADWPAAALGQVAGFRTASLHCGLKSKPENHDLALLVCEQPAAAAAVFTTNRVAAAPVHVCRESLRKNKGRARAALVNAGCANACTGERGFDDAQAMCKLAAKGLRCKPREVLVCSTGVIGKHLAMDKVERGLETLCATITRERNSGDFARAIMTTDLVPKTAGCTVEMAGTPVRFAGAIKGSGMIAPRMATTLGYLATDAAVKPGVLQAALADVIDETVNCITVDGDTSTNDTFIAMASGQAGNKTIKDKKGEAFAALRAGLFHVCDSLARQVAADGEGAEHTVTIYVGGTRKDKDARKIARAIAESPLVKTAIAGCDPNWGRMVAAAGRSGVDFDPDQTSLEVCGVELFRGGTPTNFDEAEVSARLKQRDVSLVLLVGDGPGRARFYTCDLTHGYITINADYHT